MPDRMGEEIDIALGRDGLEGYFDGKNRFIYTVTVRLKDGTEHRFENAYCVLWHFWAFVATKDEVREFGKPVRVESAELEGVGPAPKVEFSMDSKGGEFCLVVRILSRRSDVYRHRTRGPTRRPQARRGERCADAPEG